MNEVKTNTTYTLWDSTPVISDWKEILEEDFPELSEQERMAYMYEENERALEDLRCNLNIALEQPILLIADLGFWNGRRMGYVELENGKISDCFYCEGSYGCKWYLDENGDLRCNDAHHDSTNYYLYRVYKSGISEARKRELKEKIYKGIVTQEDIEAVTDSVGVEIAKIFGLSTPAEVEE